MSLEMLLHKIYLNPENGGGRNEAVNWEAIQRDECRDS